MDLNKDAVEKTISDLVAQFPNRWEQAAANPKLRGWFVNKVMKKLGYTKAYQRGAVSYTIDQAASTAARKD